MKPDLPYGPKKGKVFEIKPDKPKRKKGICASLRCRHKAETHRPHSRRAGRPVFNKYCARCRARRRKARNPIGYAFSKLRSRAKERGHEFTLTLEEWTVFWTDNGLGELRGKGKNDLTVDRIKSRLGYTKENIQVLTNSANGRKSNKDESPF